MTEGIKAQHPPAIRVGGRRLSMSMKPKAPIPAEATVTNASPEAGDKKTETTDTVLDYPRPAAPAIEDATQQHQQQEVHRNEEELPPKRNKKNNVQESAHWKTETTRPTRNLNEGNKSHSMGVRIGQPAGKAFGI